MTDKDYDVIITGAGPSGLSSALEAAKNGADTLVLEKKQAIGEPTRTSGGTWKDYLENYPFSKKALGNPIRGFYFCPPSLKEVYFELNKTVGYVINVKAFYQELAMMASKAGARIRLNSKVERLVMNDNSITGVSLSTGEEINGKVFIDASGMSAVLAKQVGLHSGKTRARSLKANKAAAKFNDQDWNSLIKHAEKFNEYPDIGLRILKSEFSIRDLFKISPKFAVKLGFKAI